MYYHFCVYWSVMTHSWNVKYWHLVWEVTNMNLESNEASNIYTRYMLLTFINMIWKHTHEFLIPDERSVLQNMSIWTSPTWVLISIVKQLYLAINWKYFNLLCILGYPYKHALISSSWIFRTIATKGVSRSLRNIFNNKRKVPWSVALFSIHS